MKKKTLRLVVLDESSDGAQLAAKELEEEVRERKKIEQEIEALSRFPSENPNPVLRITADGTILYTNDIGREIFGVQVGKRIPDRYLPILEKAIASRQYASFEEKIGERYFSSVMKSILGTDYDYLKDIIYELFYEQKQPGQIPET